MSLVLKVGCDRGRCKDSELFDLIGKAFLTESDRGLFTNVNQNRQRLIVYLGDSDLGMEMD